MSGLPWLNNSLWFPNPETALKEPEGLLCAGGDLSVERLTEAYKRGIFPWYSKDQPILWWSPNPRCVLEFSKLHIAKSMRRTLNNPELSYSFDTQFRRVIEGCAAPRKYSSETWILDEMVDAYCELHDQNIAHSIEIWRSDQLIGGLYGISLGRCFFGESMYGLEPNISKYAFIKLALSLQEWGCQLFDCQLPNSHLTSLGATTIARCAYLTLLQQNIALDHHFPWH